MDVSEHLLVPKCYIAIDMKSFYASVECVARGLDPLKTKLLVADSSRSDQTICLAVSPALKAIGVPSRPRLFEAKQAIEQYEKAHNTKVFYITAVPRMLEYEKVSAQIYGIFLKYVAAEDIHVYSIDESFIDCTPYLHLYEEAAMRTHQSPAHVMALTMIKDVLKQTGITATVGIGTNLYLAKVAMDIVAKKAPADKDGVRIADLNEESYKTLLWPHTPLTDFWQIGRGKARRLERNMMFTMGDVAERSQIDEEWFYRTFGIDAEILIDHAWGIEPVTMHDIKSYKSDNHSLSNGQVLPRPYKYEEACIVLKEMIDVLCCDMYKKNLMSSKFTWWVSFDYKSLEYCPHYDGPLAIDWYGRLHPAHAGGTVNLRTATNISKLVSDAILNDVIKKTDHRILFRKLGICACNIESDGGYYQMDLFTDYDAINRERQIHEALLNIRTRYGANSMLKGINFLDGATTRERNVQIGGHKA
ncbi:Y-family DNA polymerase [Pseudobutyrivibrio sp.]|uniref:Y-family DNA polymerase n=1 Tax=Pseudobutyrivibrio sp. TaxID=2014367 RepID=UPI001B76F09B|nr:DNA methylase [Pseudobutyrivibrio sp.]MBP3261003.1 DNA methylase [Pseudobutyrivibrio sp.]